MCNNRLRFVATDFVEVNFGKLEDPVLAGCAHFSGSAVGSAQWILKRVGVMFTTGLLWASKENGVRHYHLALGTLAMLDCVLGRSVSWVLFQAQRLAMQQKRAEQEKQAAAAAGTKVQTPLQQKIVLQKVQTPGSTAQKSVRTFLVAYFVPLFRNE